MLAVNDGDIATVSAMIEADHPVDYRAEVWGKSPLHVAFINADLPMAALLVKSGAPLNSRKSKYRDTPLECLAEYCENPNFPIERFETMSRFQSERMLEVLQEKRCQTDARRTAQIT